MSAEAPSERLDLAAVGGGTRLLLRVQPRARQNAILGVHAGALKVAVAAAPDKGKANQAVTKLLAEALGLPATSIAVIAGHASRDKAAFVPLPPATVADRLRRGKGKAV